jgi:hypothetical protein
MTPMRSRIVGPPLSATRSSASIATCHSGVLGFRSFRDVGGGIPQRNQSAAVRPLDRTFETIRSAHQRLLRLPDLGEINSTPYFGEKHFPGIMGRRGRHRLSLFGVRGLYTRGLSYGG